MRELTSMTVRWFAVAICFNKIQKQESVSQIFALKTIGLGRAGKGVDLVVAQRQKNKPIAWSVNGSGALAVLKANYLNAKLTA